MSFIILLSVSLLILLWGLGLYNRFGSEFRLALANLRITLIAADGEALFDSAVRMQSLDNHSRRPEMLEALREGYGQSARRSDTLEEKTWYCAVKTDDGKILRLALSERIASEIVSRLMPVILLCLLLALLVALISARWLTARLVAPISALNADGVNAAAYDGAYDELMPFVRKIAGLRKEIHGRRAEMRNQILMTRAITESMKEGLVLVDRRGRVRSLNASASAIFGAHAVKNKDILYLCRDIDFLGAVRACLSHGREETQVAIERGDRIYAVYVHPVHAGGRLGGAVILLLDTTEKQQAEKQRRQFSANVSHELKTPLTTIAALSEMIGADLARPEDIRDFSQKISGQVRRLISIIDDIIRLSEFDEGTADKRFTAFDLKELAQSVLDGLREKARPRGISLELRGERETMTANARLIEDLLYNLVDNAIKYNVDAGRVVVSLEGRDDCLIIRVSDTGIGIAREHQNRVFERFYRVDRSRSQRTGGTGLGLSIVRHIVAHHGGSVALDSGGQGTTVTCTFRRDPAAIEANAD